MNIRSTKAKRLGLTGIILYSNLIAFFAAALVLRSVDLENTPGVNGDEAFYGFQAECLISGCPLPKATPTGHFINLFHVGLEVAFLHFSAPTITVLRLPALIAGVLAIILTYLLGRRVFGEATSALAAILLASSPTAIAFSRFGWDSSWTPLFSLLALISAMAGRPLCFLLSMLPNLNVNFTNVFLLPTLLPMLLIVGLAKRRGNRAATGVFVATTLLGIIGLCLLTWILALPTLSTMQRRPTQDIRFDPVQVYFFMLRLGRMLSGVSTYRYIAGDMTPHDIYVHDVGFWGLVALSLFLGLPKLVRSRYREYIALILGIFLGSIAFYAVGGLSALRPGYERYGTFLLVPSIFAVSVLLSAPFLERAGSIGSQRRRWLFAVASAFGWMMLYDFHQNYLQPIWKTGGSAHRTFRTAAIEPKKQALALILEDLGAASDSDPLRQTAIVAEDWWLYSPLFYLAAPRSDVSVLFLEELIRDDRLKSVGGGAYFVGFIDGPLETRVRGSGPARFLKQWTVNDRAGQPLLKIFRLAE
jgi:hypothetical protein